jgi:hypothetical protein
VSAITEVGFVSEPLTLGSTVFGFVLCSWPFEGCCPCCGAEFGAVVAVPLGASFVSISSAIPDTSVSAGHSLPYSEVWGLVSKTTHRRSIFLLPALAEGIDIIAPKDSVWWLDRLIAKAAFLSMLNSQCFLLHSSDEFPAAHGVVCILPIATFHALFYKAHQSLTKPPMCV